MDKIKYLLDTNMCIHYLNGQFNLDQKITRVGFDKLYISELTILEMLYGVMNSDSTNKSKNLRRLEGFENMMKGRILPIRPAFEEFSTQKVRLRKLGTTISDFDLLIGCTALIHGFTLASRNVKEMNRIEGIKLENWID